MDGDSVNSSNNLRQRQNTEFGTKNQNNYRQQQGLFGRQNDNPSRNLDSPFRKSSPLENHRGQTTLFGKKFPDNSEAIHEGRGPQRSKQFYNYSNQRFIDHDSYHSPKYEDYDDPRYQEQDSFRSHILNSRFKDHSIRYSLSESPENFRQASTSYGYETSNNNEIDSPDISRSQQTQSSQEDDDYVSL